MRKLVNMQKKGVAFFMITALLIATQACDTLIDVDLPSDQLTIESVFSDSSTVESAANALYARNFYSNNFYIDVPYYLSGMSDDAYHAHTSFEQYNNNALSENNSGVKAMWTDAYQSIYLSNSLIHRLEGSTAISEARKLHFIGEAKFFRAYCYFMLINLYGDVPLVLELDFKKTGMLPREKTEIVYAQIVRDLQDAEAGINEPAKNKDNSKITKSAASAQLASVYLFQERWADAEAKATEVINTSGYELDSLARVFLRTSKEAILRMHNWRTSYLGRTYWGRISHLKGYNYVRDELLNAFEPGDQRREVWMTKDPKIGFFQFNKYRNINNPKNEAMAEDKVFLRLAEQYLIRAEARIHQGKLTEAIEDLNLIRKRASLPALDPSLSKEELIVAVAKERRLEYFAEDAYRWFDLKRTGQIDAVLGSIPSKNWAPYKALLPIPERERRYNPNLTPNPGYGAMN